MFAGTRLVSPGGLIAVEIITGGALTPLYRDRYGDHWVIAVPGQRFTMRAVNLTSGPLEVLASIDQQNVLAPGTADRYRDGGHVINGGGAWTWPGWRRNNQYAQPLVFTDPESGVAAHADGSLAGTGVIGFAAYREQPRVFRDNPAAGHAPAVARDVYDVYGMASPGVAVGISEELIESRVTEVHFRRTPGEPDMAVIRYDLEDALRDEGVLDPGRPHPFPGIGTGYETYPTVR